jgi:hypothetical protein
MSERVFVNVPGQRQFHMGIVTGWREYGDDAFDVVKTYCGLELVRTLNTEEATMKGWGFCPACVNAENKKKGKP